MSTYIHGPEFRKYRVPILLLFIFCMVSTMSFLATRSMRGTSAAPVQGFNPGNIISDAVMANANSMTVDEIQKFLVSKNKCNNTNYQYWQSLTTQYPNTIWRFENGHFVCLAEERFGDGIEIGEGQTAAEIIYRAAQDYQINPQVLIVLLEKEQGLITDTFPNSRQYRSATGYGCPDTAPCATEYYGFKNQVRKAAAMFRSVLDGGWSNYPAGQTLYVRYNPNASCGGTNILIENRATSALYRYTPYQPNAAALAAGTGTGDACSAYGNRNFYLYFTNWFGSTQLKVEGSLATLPDGEYAFTSAANAKLALGFLGNNAQPANFNLSDQTIRWKLQRDASTGQYYIINSSNNQYLMTQSASVQDGTNVSVSQTATCAKLWKIYQTPDGFLTFESSCGSGMVASVADANVQIGLINGTAGQKWSMIPPQAIKDGLYEIIAGTNNNLRLDIAGDFSRVGNGSNVWVYESNNATTRMWQVKYDTQTGMYDITSPIANLSLDVMNGGISNGANIQVYSQNGTAAQKWYIRPQNGGYAIISAKSGLALDILNGGNVSKSNVQLYAANQTKAQTWSFKEIAMNKQQIANGVYEIVAGTNPRKALDVYGGAKQARNGTNVEIFERNQTDAQKWRITYDAQNDAYAIINVTSELSLDVTNGSVANGANIQVYTSNDTAAQRWHIVKNDDGSFTILSLKSGLALDVYGGATYDFANVHQFVGNNTLAQKWQLIKLQ